MSAISSITESWNNHTFQEVESHIKGNYLPVQYGQYTGTTSEDGNFALPRFSNKVVVICAWCCVVDLMCLPLADDNATNTNADGSNVWWMHFFHCIREHPVKGNTLITVYYLYYTKP